MLDFVNNVSQEISTVGADVGYIAPMPERRIVRANHHAIPLLIDIVESTAFLPGGDKLRTRFIDELSSHAATQTSFGAGEYYLGFADHLPFGFVGLTPLDDCAELRGPCLYRDYLGQGYGGYLLSEIVNISCRRELHLLYELIPTGAQEAWSFLIRNDFELISTDSPFIKRWRDGLLADLPVEDGTALFARLIGREV